MAFIRRVAPCRQRVRASAGRLLGAVSGRGACLEVPLQLEERLLEQLEARDRDQKRQGNPAPRQRQYRETVRPERTGKPLLEASVSEMAVDETVINVEAVAVLAEGSEPTPAQGALDERGTGV